MIFNISKKTYKLFRDVVALGLSLGLTFAVFVFELDVLGKNERISQTQNALDDSTIARFREHGAYVRGANKLKRELGERNARIIDLKKKLHDQASEIASLQKELQDRDFTIHLDGHAIAMYKRYVDSQNAENVEQGDEIEKLKHQLKKLLEEIDFDDDDDESSYEEDPIASISGRYYGTGLLINGKEEEEEK